MKYTALYEKVDLILFIYCNIASLFLIYKTKVIFIYYANLKTQKDMK